MPVYKWRLRPTKHFGEVWVPFAQISIRGPDGRSQAFALQIDSGATVSLLRRSVADLLGIKRESGRRIDLTGVGGSRMTAHVHDLETRLDDEWPSFAIPFAIADVETVPNLLGRLGVFDKLQVDFDVSLRETHFSAPWLDDSDRIIWNCFIEAETSILQRIPGTDLPQSVKEATRRMISRASLLLASTAGLVKLHRHYSAPLFIRALFEQAAQFEYMMQKPEERAQRYLDYEHVTRHQHEQAFLTKAGGLLGQLLRSSPLRKDGEPRVRAEYERVIPQFLNKKGKPERNWYCSQFRQLVEGLGTREYDWVVEHDLWYKSFSAWAHADALTADRHKPESPDKGSDALTQCYPYYARMLLRASDKIILASEQFLVLTGLAKGLK